MINSLEEAISREEEIAKEQEKLACSLYERQDYEISKNCIWCAKEHRQRAEWLRELKKLREIPDKLVPKYRDDIRDEYNRGANEMLKEVIDDIRKYIEEVNADADRSYSRNK